jgi:hypothetical protein
METKDTLNFHTVVLVQTEDKQQNGDYVTTTRWFAGFSELDMQRFHSCNLKAFDAFEKHTQEERLTNLRFVLGNAIMYPGKYMASMSIGETQYVTVVKCLVEILLTLTLYEDAKIKFI